jgi:hypothetical protein
MIVKKRKTPSRRNSVITGMRAANLAARSCRPHLYMVIENINIAIPNKGTA